MSTRPNLDPVIYTEPEPHWDAVTRATFNLGCRVIDYADDGTMRRYLKSTDAPKVQEPKPTDHQHEWLVGSTCLGDGSIMVGCRHCPAWGTIDDPTREEWAEAFHAPSSPYLWTGDSSRVRFRGYGGAE